MPNQRHKTVDVCSKEPSPGASGQAVSGRPSGPPLRVTQMLGLCFYWAWVYLSFNTTPSINLDIAVDQIQLWVHLTSMLSGCVIYVLVIAFARRVPRLLDSRRMLIVAGLAASLGSAFYAFPSALPQGFVIAGTALSGIAASWILLTWGTLFSEFSARNIVLFTAMSFFCANLIYFGSLLMPPPVTSVLIVVLPLCATLLLPDRDKMHAYLQPDERNASRDARSGPAFSVEPAHRNAASETGRLSSPRIDLGQGYSIPLSHLPWRISIGLFVVMVVYGGMRVFIGMSQESGDGSLLLTVLLTLAAAALFVIWGLFFQGENARLGVIYKMLLPLLATALLVLVNFGPDYVALTGPLATVCDTTIEILSWMLLADIARTSRTPAFLVFATGRLAIQFGMFCGQLGAWLFADSIVAFTTLSILSLMLAMGFMFRNEDTVMVFESPTETEREKAERIVGHSVEEHLSTLAETYGLTQRETEIFILWATGHGSKYIQSKLSISGDTVKTHVRHIYEKCGVHNRAEVIALMEQPR